MVPPEMMNGSTSGSAQLTELDPRDSHGAARCRSGRRHQVEEAELAAAAMQKALLLQLQHPRDQPALRWKTSACSARWCGSRRWRGTRTAEAGRRCEAATLSQPARAYSRITPAGADVAGSRRGAAGHARRPRRPSDTQVALAQLVAAVCYAALGGPEPVEAHQRVRAGRGVQHVQLEGVVVAGVHQLERERGRAPPARRGSARAPRRSQRSIRPRSSASVSPASVGEKSFSSASDALAPRAAPSRRWCGGTRRSRKGSSSSGR